MFPSLEQPPSRRTSPAPPGGDSCSRSPSRCIHTQGLQQAFSPHALLATRPMRYGARSRATARSALTSPVFEPSCGQDGGRGVQRVHWDAQLPTREPRVRPGIASASLQLLSSPPLASLLSPPPLTSFSHLPHQVVVAFYLCIVGINALATLVCYCGRLSWALVSPRQPCCPHSCCTDRAARTVLPSPKQLERGQCCLERWSRRLVDPARPHEPSPL